MLILFSGPEDKSGARQISLNVIISFAWRVLVGGGRKAGAGGISTTLHRLVPPYNRPSPNIKHYWLPGIADSTAFHWCP